MASLPPNFGQDSGTNGFPSNGSEEPPSSPSEPVSIPLTLEEQERIQDTSQQLRRIFLILVGVGAGVGLIIAIALVIVLARFGLVGSPQETVPPSETLQQTM